MLKKLFNTLKEFSTRRNLLKLKPAQTSETHKKTTTEPTKISMKPRTLSLEPRMPLKLLKPTLPRPRMTSVLPVKLGNKLSTNSRKLLSNLPMLKPPDKLPLRFFKMPLLPTKKLLPLWELLSGTLTKLLLLLMLPTLPRMLLTEPPLWLLPTEFLKPETKLTLKLNSQPARTLIFPDTLDQ